MVSTPSSPRQDPGSRSAGSSTCLMLAMMPRLNSEPIGSRTRTPSFSANSAHGHPLADHHRPGRFVLLEVGPLGGPPSGPRPSVARCLVRRRPLLFASILPLLDIPRSLEAVSFSSPPCSAPGFCPLLRLSRSICSCNPPLLAPVFCFSVASSTAPSRPGRAAWA